MSAKVDRVMIDADVLMASALADDERRGQAIDRFTALAEAGSELWVCRRTLGEYLAKQPISKPELIADVRRFEAAFHVAEDGPQVTTYLLNLWHTLELKDADLSRANLVATMLAWNVRTLLTFRPEDYAPFGGYVRLTD